MSNGQASGLQGLSPGAADPSARISQLESQLAATRHTADALRDVAAALNAPVDLDRLLSMILHKSAEIVDADRATLYLVEEHSGQLVSRFVVGDSVQTIRVAVGQGIAGTVLETARSIRVVDAYQDPRFSREWDALTGYRTRSILASPMKNHLGETVGVLQVLNKRGGESFSEQDESLLESLATQAGISIGNARLFLSVVEKNAQLAAAQARLERKVDDLRLLFDLESAMAWAPDRQGLVGGLLRQLVASLRVRVAALFLSDPSTGRFTSFRVSGDNPEELASVQHDAATGVIGHVLRDGQAIRLRLTAVEARCDALLHRLCAPRWSIVAAPVMGEANTPRGVLVLVDRSDAQLFSDDDVQLLQLIAANASTALSLLASRDLHQVNERLFTVGTLLSGILHDLRTPMTVISGYVQLMAMSESKTERESFAELIVKQFEHITSMQREVLAFARGERTLFVRRVYLNKFFDEMRARIEREIEGRPVVLKMEQEDRGTARFDEVKIARAVHNLVRNAIDAMGANGGVLTISVRRIEQNLVVDVADTGPGIPKQIEPSLFQTFVTAGKQNGTGLGLPIVKKIAEEHGGDVLVTSSPSGATFSLRIPQPEQEA